MMSAVNTHHLLIAVTFWLTQFWFSWICIWTSEWPESWFSLPRREGGGVKALWIRLDADLNRWITKSCWPWKTSKLIIQTWPWCWAQTWCNRASLWSAAWHSLRSLWRSGTWPTELTLHTWDNDGSLKRLSLGRWLPNTEAWTKLGANVWGIMMGSYLFQWHHSFTENVLNPQVLELYVFWSLWNAKTWCLLKNLSWERF